LASGPYNIFPGNGVTLAFVYTFSVISRASAIVVKVITGSTTQIKTITTDYTLDINTKTVTFLVAPASGSYVRIERATNRNRQIDYISGSVMTENNFDEDPNRLTSVDQEIEGSLSQALQLNGAGTAWDAQGLEIQNGLPGTVSTSLATVGQVQSLISGSAPATVDDGIVFSFTGDGTTQIFSLTGYKGMNRPRLWVMVDNIVQSAKVASPVYTVLNEGDGGYTGGAGGPSQVKFDTAPRNGANIEVRFMKATVAAAIPNGLITSAMLADNSVGLAAINIGAGAAGRFLEFDTNGDPTAVVPDAADISNFDTAVRASRLDQMAAPTASVSLNNQKITSLATGVDADDGVCKSQMDARVDNRMKCKSGGLAAGAMPDATSGPTSDNYITAPLGFVPDLFVLTAKFIGSGGDDATEREATYVVHFFGSTNTNLARIVGAAQTPGGKKPPLLKFSVDGQKIRCKMLELGDFTAWTQESFSAMKFGDSF